ncbi:hypothetical protein T261_6578 [Streptomyces lydicus]|nr:hypothetical protein T261_6578 [Streptomyces lydicus]
MDRTAPRRTAPAAVRLHRPAVLGPGLAESGREPDARPARAGQALGRVSEVDLEVR